MTFLFSRVSPVLSHAISSEDLGLEGQETTVDLIRPHTQKLQQRHNGAPRAPANTGHVLH